MRVWMLPGPDADPAEARSLLAVGVYPTGGDATPNPGRITLSTSAAGLTVSDRATAGLTVSDRAATITVTIQ